MILLAVGVATMVTVGVGMLALARVSWSHPAVTRASG
jgi:hypothetical protein